MYKKINYLTFDHELGVKVTQNIAQYSFHQVTYAPAKFEAAIIMSNNLGDAFTRNTLFDHDIIVKKNIACPVPSTSCDLSAPAKFEVATFKG